MTDRTLIDKTARDIVNSLLTTVGFETATPWVKIVRSKLRTMLNQRRRKK